MTIYLYKQINNKKLCKVDYLSRKLITNDMFCMTFFTRFARTSQLDYEWHLAMNFFKFIKTSFSEGRRVESIKTYQ